MTNIILTGNVIEILNGSAILSHVFGPEILKKYTANNYFAVN
jgi:hypothetical protein